jgi:hypothetical protein
MTQELKPFEELSRSGKFHREHPEYAKEWRREHREYFRVSSGEWQRNHPEYVKKLHREYRRTNLEYVREESKKWAQKCRLLVLDHYSNGTMTCAICGEDNINFLTIDHINGGGRRHLREIRAGSIAQWLSTQYRKTGEWPQGFQVLCANCNSIKSFEENGYTSRNWTSKFRSKICKTLGGRCVICGFEDDRALNIDHANGGGKKEMRRFKSSQAYYRNIRNKIQAEIGIFGCSKSYQLLCANHNFEKELQARKGEEFEYN